MQITALVDGLRIRQKPTLYGRIMGSLAAGETVEITAIIGHPGNILSWGQHERGYSAIRYRTQLSKTSGEAAVPSLGYPVQDYQAGWKDATGYLRHYALGYHTGADLNCNTPVWDYDAHKPVIAIASGEVVHSSNTWNGLIVIRHEPIAVGELTIPLYSRYAHVEKRLVAVGDIVERGVQIASVGRYGGSAAIPGNYHLHFDISCTDILGTKPAHWPGGSWEGCALNYVDPLKAIKDGERCTNNTIG